MENNYLNKKPDWLKVRYRKNDNYLKTLKTVKELNLNTICAEGACPNITECWSKSHAAFMILGEICTRACRFCNVKTGKPNIVNKDEPKKLAKAVEVMQLSHVVITSVDRDDLPDGGAKHFAECIKEVRKRNPKTTIEILTPDFLRTKTRIKAIQTIVETKPDVFNHNIETVPSLYREIRPGANYYNSINILDTIKDLSKNIFTKSGIMLGLGETKKEVLQVMDDLRSARVDFLTICQYLAPTKNHAKVKKYITPEEFEHLGKTARRKGFKIVSSSPFTRSSYHAGEDFLKLKSMQENKTL